MQAWPHHAKPLVVAFEVFVVDGAVIAQPLAHERAVDVVVVRPSLVARIIGRVNIDALDAAGVSREQRLQRVEVVAVDDEIVVSTTNICTGGVERISGPSDRTGSDTRGRYGTVRWCA